MKKIFITYGTTEGQTAKIAEFISDVLRDHGHDVTMVDVKDTADTVPDGYDGVIVGASVHMGKHDKHVVDFVRKNQKSLPTFRARSCRLASPRAATLLRRRATSSSSNNRRDGGLTRCPFRRCPSLHPVRLHQAAHDEEDRTRQARQPWHRSFPRLRLHRVGRVKRFAEHFATDLDSKPA